jgi:hypothetical protein
VALRPGVKAALSVGSLVIAAAALHALSPTTADPDAYYHVRHAWVYRTQGLLHSPFPWAAFSAIRDQASDLWYGFHVLLVPFSLAPSLLQGLHAAGMAVTAASLILVWLAFAVLRLPWPLAWVAVFAATGEVLFRLAMLRPQPLSLALAVLALAVLASPGLRRRGAVLFGLALLAAWIHLALAWLLPLVAALFAVIGMAHRLRPDWRSAAAIGLGTLAGFALRPQPVGALRLAWIQLGLFLEVKARGLALPFGQELQPLSLALEGPRLLLPALGVLAALLVFARLVRSQRAVDLPARVAAWTSLTLALLFALLSVRVASRSIELAAVFAAGFAGLVAREHGRGATAGGRARAFAWLAAFLAVLVPMAALRYRVRVEHARPLLAYRGVSAWLAANSVPGELVFHAWWDQFPHLFFWNPRNRYVGGMDPLFQFAHDEALFWKAHWLSTDAFPQATCGRPSCDAADLEATSLVLRRDFGAAYVLAHRSLNPRLDAYLAGEPAFRRVFDDGTDVLYRVQYDAPPPPGGSP